jgi:AmmeMemoRadiSam system protein B
VLPIREPAVAGRFYPADPEALRGEVARCLPSVPAGGAESTAIAAMLPHAGYVYSGAIAGAALAHCRVPARAVVLGPNHTGEGARRALHPPGLFRLPGALVPVDGPLTESLAREAGLSLDRAAHQHEHAIEVELPLLLAKNPALRVAALCLSVLDFEQCREIGLGLARAVRSAGGPAEVLLVASTDMSHYVSAERARNQDRLALEQVLALDPEGLYRTVRAERISMCGFIPTTVALVAARELGAREAELVRYGHSGEVSGDHEHVVGYAGIIIR